MADDLNPDDEIARLRAGIEQAKMSSIEMASVYWSFFAALVNEGFDEDQALALTIAQLQNVS